MGARVGMRPDLARVWDWLGEVPDPEIPVVSVVDLGIVREVREVDGQWVITITPTYSGCPGMHVIAETITAALHAQGLARVRIETRLAPAWTTDWMSDVAKEALRQYGIAPPVQQAIDISGLHAGIRRRPAPQVSCPRCGAARTELLSEFGSTPCKSQYRCCECREPFEYFKCH